MQKFTPRLAFPQYRLSLADFKGHHVKALTRLSQLSPQIDLVLELRDARAPISTRNLLLDRPLHGKEKIVLYSKKDLSSIDTKLLQDWHKDEKFLFVDCRNGRDIEKIIQMAKEKYKKFWPPPPLGLRLIVTGMPNVGKSTLVNTLRKVGMKGSPIVSKKSVAKVGGQPGVTRSTSEMIRICPAPDILLHDTPGVFMPHVNNIETMLSLALVGTVGHNKVDPVIVADYLLYLLNKQDPSGGFYKKYLPFPTNDVYRLLTAIGKKIGKWKKGKNGVNFDETGTAIHWVDKWRQGKEKKCLLDSIQEMDKALFDEHFKNEKTRLDSMDVALNKAVESRKRSFKDKKAAQQNMLFSKL